MNGAEERPVADSIEGIPPPSACESVIGHDDVLNAMFESYKSGKMHHAWLLSGPRGIGKASLATLFAKYIFTHPDQDGLEKRLDPRSISTNVHGQVAQGAHPQFLHLTRPWDEKAKRFKTRLSVEEVRKTMGFYGMTAGAGGWRITLVDAIDEMNASAANALLKILEEPPKRSLFFVLSHATGKPLATIRSRCRHVAVQPLSQPEILSVIDNLGVQSSEKERLRAVALAQGSVRRTIQILHSAVLKDFDRFEQLMSAGATGAGSDWIVAHKIADSLSRRGQEESLALFRDLVANWISSRVRKQPQSGLRELAGWAELWDKANRSYTLAEAFNLDRKQVVLSLFSDLFERNRLA